MKMAQFIELNKLLGVTHFTFYEHTLTEDVSCMLKQYINRGEITLLQWNLDFIPLVRLISNLIYTNVADIALIGQFHISAKN